MALAGVAAMTVSVGVASPPGTREPTAAPAVAVQRVDYGIPKLGEEAAMVLVGAALIGLAAVVRRAA